MKQVKRMDAAGLFLLELILSILLFSLLAAVCVSIFAKAHMISASSAELTAASSETENVAETFRSTDSERSFLKTISRLYPHADVQLRQGQAQLYFNSEFAECKKSNAAYKLNITVYQEKSCLLAAALTYVSCETGKSITKQTAEHAVSASASAKTPSYSEQDSASSADDDADSSAVETNQTAKEDAS